MMVPELNNFPKMNTWAPIKRNILTEDDHHNNIPYFGDKVGDWINLSNSRNIARQGNIKYFL